MHIQREDQEVEARNVREPTLGRLRAHPVRHIAELDGLRGVAVLMVVAYHYASPLLSISGGHSLLGRVLGLGWAGVDLFFVLSGFLITGILVDSRGTPHFYRNFVVRRILRIFPLYYATLFVFFGLVPAMRSVAGISLVPSLPVHGQIWFWTYLHNWVQPFGVDSPVLGHLWSLAVEEQYYLLWPLLVWWAKSPRRVVLMSAAVAAASLGCRMALVAHGTSPEAVYRWTICRLDALALGSMLAATLREVGSDIKWYIRSGAISGAFVAVLIVADGGRAQSNSGFMQGVGYTLVALFFAAVVGHAAVRRGAGSVFARLLRLGPLQAFGRVSYCMYIVHIPILAIAAVVLHRHEWLHRFTTTPLGALALVAIGTACSFGVAQVSWILFEVRFIRLKERFSSAVPVAAAEASERSPAT